MKISGISSLHLFTAENSKLPSPGSWRKPCDAWMPGWSAQQGPRCSAPKVPCVFRKRTRIIDDGKGTPNNLDDMLLWFLFPMFFRFFYFTVYLLTFRSMGMWGCCCPIDGMILVPSGTCHASLSIGHSIFGVDNEGLANESGIYDIYIYVYNYI